MEDFSAFPQQEPQSTLRSGDIVLPTKKDPVEVGSSLVSKATGTLELAFLISQTLALCFLFIVIQHINMELQKKAYDRRTDENIQALLRIIHVKK